jgi:hypothetical protein
MSVPRTPWGPLLVVWAFFFAGPAWHYLPVLAENPWTIVQDDARHFVVWLRALAAPELFPDDPMAAFFRAVTPDLYEALYLPALRLGIDVVAWQMIVLMPAIAALSLLAMERVIAIFEADLALRLAILMVLAAFAHAFYVHGLPRDFALPILCFAIFAYATGRPVLMGAVMGLGAAIYPSAAITAGVGLGLCEVARLLRERRVTRQSATIVVAALAGALGLAAFMAGSSGLGETFRLAEVQAVPIFQEGGRTEYFEGESAAERIACGHRAGLFAACIPGPLWPLTALVYAAVIGGTLAFLARRNKGDWRLLAWLCAGGLGLFALASVFAFEFHLPSRYARWSIQFVAVFCLAILMSLGLMRLLALLRAPRFVAPVVFAALVAVAAPGELTRLHEVEIDTAPGVSAALREMTEDTVVAGVVRQIDNIPAFAGRSVLAALELSVPYKKDYHAEMARRVAVLRGLFTETDPRRWQALHAASGADVYLLDDPDAAGAPGAVGPANWSGSFADAPPPAGPTVFAAFPAETAACVLAADGGLRLMDGACFAGRLPR